MGNRKILVFDTETTGIPNTVERFIETPSLRKSLITDVKLAGEIVQFCGILCDLDTLNLNRIINFYCMPTEPISLGAYNTHKLDAETLKRLSEGRHFEDYVFQDYKDIFFDDNVIFASYNIKFDADAIYCTLRGYGMKIDLGDTVSELTNLRKGVRYKYCIMNSFRLYETMKGVYSPRNYKLSKAIELEKLTPTVEAVVNNLQLKCPELVKCDGELLYHNALYDTVAAWGLLNRMRGVF